MFVKVIFNDTGVGFSIQFFLLWLSQNVFLMTSKTRSYKSVLVVHTLILCLDRGYAAFLRCKNASEYPVFKA